MSEGVAFKSKCSRCPRQMPVRVGGRMVHLRSDIPGLNDWIPCLNFDAECRSIAEPLGYYTFAWLPKTCRNGKVRWFRWVERHTDGTFTLGDRAG